MTAIFTLLVVLTLSFGITRLAIAALTLTGLSEELARLQSISAFTGVGFTTQESERIVQHPVRRRVLILLMILGNAGIITAISSLILSMVEVSKADQWWVPAAWLLGGIAVLWGVATSRWVDRQMSRVMRYALGRWTHLEAEDYANLLHLTGDYSVRECRVDEDDWWANRRLAELRLHDEGVTVLGITRANGDYVGVPRGETRIFQHDRLLLYGPEHNMDELDERRRGTGGDAAHERAVDENNRRQGSERQRDVMAGYE